MTAMSIIVMVSEHHGRQLFFFFSFFFFFFFLLDHMIDNASLQKLQNGGSLLRMEVEVRVVSWDLVYWKKRDPREFHWDYVIAIYLQRERIMCYEVRYYLILLDNYTTFSLHYVNRGSIYSEIHYIFFYSLSQTFSLSIFSVYPKI